MQEPDARSRLEPLERKLEGKEGILHLKTDPKSAAVDLEFDPSVLRDSEVRELLEQHINQVESTLRKSVWRLESNACEACALKLEKRVARLPGVRRATATYLGKVLSVTFDSAEENQEKLEQNLHDSGANISPLETSAVRKSFKQRLWSGELNEEISCALGLIFLIAGVSLQATGTGFFTTGWLFGAAYLFAGQQGVRSAWASLREGEIDIDVLMVLAAIGAALIGAPFEGALLLFLFSLSNVLQKHAIERTSKAIESLLHLRPSTALTRRDGHLIRVPVEELKIDEFVVVKPGEQIPVDGRVTAGKTSVNEASLTGESLPVAKQPGSSVFAGTLNQTGGIDIQVGKEAADSTLARMVKLVAEAQAEKSSTQRFLENAERYYALGVILLTIAVLLVPWLLQGEAFGPAFYRAMTVMVVASPCALIISTPATVLSAIGGAARKGILIKGGSHLDRAATIDVVAIDKTGTLTVGKPSVTAMVTADGEMPLAELPAQAAELLGFAAALEERSEHPLAHAIVEGARKVGQQWKHASAFQSTTGKGAEASIDGRNFIIGSERLFREIQAIDLERFTPASNRLQDDGQTCVWFGERTAEDKIQTHAVFALADTVRPGSKELVATLKRIGVRRVVMLTGDQNRVAQAIGRETGVDEIHAGLLPTDKLEVIRQLKQQGKVLMAGDGVNDAPALAASDLSVAMGAVGTDVAMETADIVLMGDRVENLPLILAHARRARRILLQNLIFAASIIAILILAALGFALPLPIGVIGHEGSTVLVCLNGLRLLSLKENFLQSDSSR